MKIAYFDCFNGAAGDMLVASLIDAGADLPGLTKSIERLNLPGFRLTAERTTKQGIKAFRFNVQIDDAPKPHRHLKHVIGILQESGLDGRIKEQATRIFTRLAEAEARVHGTTVEKVHFHEVGAIDAIVDVVGVCIALEMLGVERVFCSPIPVGSGTIVCDHGVMPVPAPATAELLQGVPIAATDEPGELTTPTGAAILTTLSMGFGPMPGMTPTAIGYGAGTREGKTRPNVLRVLIGENEVRPSGEIERLVLLESNLDDATPQMLAHCSRQLFAAGALDVWTQPIVMKKERAGALLCVLSRVSDATAMERMIFRETPTLGIRRKEVDRIALPRRTEVIHTRYGEIRLKIALCESHESAYPEYDDCSLAAIKHGVAFRDVVAEAQHAWRTRH